MAEAFTAFHAGNGFVLNTPAGGSWYVAPNANPAAIAGEDGRVLLAQLTVSDDENGEMVCGVWNMQWRTGGATTMENRELYFTTGCNATALGCTDEACVQLVPWLPTTMVRALKMTSAAYVEATALRMAYAIAKATAQMPAMTARVSVSTMPMATVPAMNLKSLVAPMQRESLVFCEATEDDGSCAVNDECGVCGGDGIAPGACDCEGNLPDPGYM